MMPLYRLNMSLEGVIGDDHAYNSIVYSDVPDGFRIKDITVPDDCPLTAALWEAICAKADLVYMDHEIVGRTIVDFHNNLERAFALNADTFERLLEVYHDDIAKPILGRTETVVYGANADPIVITDVRTDTMKHKGVNKHFDIPLDGSEANPSSQDTAESEVTSGTVEDRHTHSGTVRTTLSDLGVRPNYETLNGFLDNNRTALKVFCDIFRDCFTLHFTLRW